MDTAVINIKIDPKMKTKAQAIAEDLGFSLSALIKGYLSQLVRSKRVMFDLNEEPSGYLIKTLARSKKDFETGNVSPTFSNAKEAIAWLKKPGNKKYVGKI